MAELTGKTVRAENDVVIDNQTTADAGSKRKTKNIMTAFGRAVFPFAQADGGDIVYY
jgi:hypothetical protein